MVVDWYDFVVFTTAGPVVDRIAFDFDYWQKHMLPALRRFYVDFMADELILGDLGFTKYCEA